MIVFLRRCMVAAPWILLGGLAACAGGAHPQTVGRPAGAEAEVRVDPPTAVSLADSGKAVNLAVGGTLIVRLPMGPTTGHVWRIESVDREVLELAERPETETTAEAGDATVEPRARIFSFVAKRPGTTRLEIGLRRPWESAPARRTFTLEVTVR